MTSRDTRVAAQAQVAAACVRTGFTLLELVVVLAIMGLGMAVVAPSLVLRSPSPEEALQRVVADARRVATRRAQTVSLDIDDDGEWRVVGSERDAPEVLLTGELDASSSLGVHLRITPLGLCLSEARGADSGGRRPAVSFDPLTCSLRRSSAEPP
ncbi:MAG: prepilin-type N-terminal cleavage/methylation domain-containing protein [Gemmatimonadota bacterium]|nr:prepilin-type N-terminal cleavage/methylation domain-containing protein [Gemmatimonadota bacterium]